MKNFATNHCLSALLGLLFLTQSACATAPTLLVTQLDGTKTEGQLVGWNAEELKLQADGKTLALVPSQLLRVRWPVEPTTELTETKLVEFIDGTRLPYQSFTVKEGQASISTLLAKQVIELPTDRIARVQLSPEVPLSVNPTAELEGDVLTIRKKSGSLDNLSGILGDITSEQVLFNWDGETIPVKRAKVAALSYFHAQQPSTQHPICWLNLLNGGRLPAYQITSREQTIVLRSSHEQEFVIPVNLISFADYSQGKLAYLSDLRPTTQNWEPRIGLPTSAELIHKHGLPRRDQSFTGSVLSLIWPSSNPRSSSSKIKTYDKGLAIRSRTEAKYRIPRGMRRFTAIAGIDPETIHEGNVTLEILADRRSIWQGEIDGDTPPTTINVELDNARELCIVVSYGANLDFGDRLHLVEARFSQ